MPAVSRRTPYGACFVVSRPLQPLRLEPERSQRRSQLVGSVGDEVRLRGKSRSDTPEQQVELLDEGMHLVRKSLFAHLGEIVGLSTRHLVADSRHGGKGGADHPPDGNHQDRRHQRDRRNRALGQLARHLVASGHVLRDLDGL